MRGVARATRARQLLDKKTHEQKKKGRLSGKQVAKTTQSDTSTTPQPTQCAIHQGKGAQEIVDARVTPRAGGHNGCGAPQAGRPRPHAADSRVPVANAAVPIATPPPNGHAAPPEGAGPVGRAWHWGPQSGPPPPVGPHAGAESAHAKQVRVSLGLGGIRSKKRGNSSHKQATRWRRATRREERWGWERGWAKQTPEWSERARQAGQAIGKLDDSIDAKKRKLHLLARKTRVRRQNCVMQGQFGVPEGEAAQGTNRRPSPSRRPRVDAPLSYCPARGIGRRTLVEDQSGVRSDQRSPRL